MGFNVPNAGPERNASGSDTGLRLPAIARVTRHAQSFPWLVWDAGGLKGGKGEARSRASGALFFAERVPIPAMARRRRPYKYARPPARGPSRWIRPPCVRRWPAARGRPVACSRRIESPRSSHARRAAHGAACTGIIDQSCRAHQAGRWIPEASARERIFSVHGSSRVRGPKSSSMERRLERRHESGLLQKWRSRKIFRVFPSHKDGPQLSGLAVQDSPRRVCLRTALEPPSPTYP